MSTSKAYNKIEEIAVHIILIVIAKIIPKENFCITEIACKMLETPERIINAIIGEKSKFTICKLSFLKIFK